MQERNVTLATFAQGLYRQLNFPPTSKTDGKNDRLPRFSDRAQERNMYRLIGGDLIKSNANVPLEKIHGGVVEWRRKQYDTELIGNFFQLRLPLPWRMCFLVQIPEPLSLPVSGLIFSFHPEVVVIDIKRDGRGRIRLELYRVRSRVFGGTHQLRGFLVFLMVVAGNLGDDECLFFGANSSIPYLHME